MSVITVSSASSTLATAQPIPALEKSDNFKTLIAPIVEKIKPFVNEYRASPGSKRPAIAIAGCSGVGKSYFATKLLEHVKSEKIKAAVLKFDDFLDPDLSQEKAKSDIHPRFDYQEAHAFFRKMLDGQELIEKPCWNQKGSKPFKEKEIFDLRGIELLIFEGEFTLCDKQTYDLVDFSSIRVIIDAKDSDIIRWDWERARYLETDSFSEFTELRTKGLAKYRTLLEKLKQYADFIIKKESNHTYTLEPIHSGFLRET